MAEKDKGLTYNLQEQTCLLNALDLAIASARRAAKNTKNPDIAKCHESTARALLALQLRVSQ